MSGLIGHRGLLLQNSGGAPPVDPIYAYSPKVVLDPSDLSTLFQDDAATIPVTADGDPVGCIKNQAPGYTNADFIQATSGARPIYRTSGGKHWLELNGTAWMYSRAAGALAFPICNFFVGARLDITCADFGPIIGHPYATTHSSPFWTYCLQRRSGGYGFVYNNSGARQDISTSIVLNDTVYSIGISSMWDELALALRNAMTRINGAVDFSVYPGVNTLIYTNTNVSTLGAHAQGIVPMTGRFYGAAFRDSAVATQAEINVFEVWINNRLLVPVVL